MGKWRHVKGKDAPWGMLHYRKGLACWQTEVDLLSLNVELCRGIQNALAQVAAQQRWHTYTFDFMHEVRKKDMWFMRISVSVIKFWAEGDRKWP